MIESITAGSAKPIQVAAVTPTGSNQSNATAQPHAAAFDHAMLDLLPVGAMILDQDFRIQLWNQTLSEWSGISSSNAVGKLVTDLYPSVAEQRYLSRLQQVFGTGLPATFSASFHKHFLPVPARHGLECQWMIQETSVRRLADRHDHAIVTIQDVSYQYVQLERLKAERVTLQQTSAALGESNRMLETRNEDLDEFNYVASHDLQEPLRKMITLSAFIEEDLSTEQLPEATKRHLKLLRESAERMRTLVRDLLVLSRSASGNFATEDVDLGEIVRNAIDNLEIAIEEKRATIHLGELPIIRCNPRMISQTIQNLIGNALKFSSERDAKIQVTAERRNSEWIIGIEDNGIGIDPRFAERVFKPFQRLHTREEYVGTGIGLAICKKAVARHGGRIWVEPAEQKGCRFLFSIPYAT